MADPDFAAAYGPVATRWLAGAHPEDSIYECTMFGCEELAVFMTAPEPCSPTCEHMHALGFPTCAAHSVGKKIVEAIGD